MTLTQLLDRSGVVPARLVGDAELVGAQLDSRKCVPGTLFVCMPGMTNDSQAFISSAVANGASAAITYNAAGTESATAAGIAAAQLETADFADSIWRLCDVLFDHPTRNMRVVGVTGTNGKTTTAWLIRDMLRALSLKAAYLGTLGFHLPGEERELSNTTPFAVELYNLLAEAHDKGVEALAMEVSSHALAEKRADGVEFDAAVFTNLTQDHLDYHKTMDQYETAKWRLFGDLPKQTSKRFVPAVNVDDPTGARWVEGMTGDFVAFRQADWTPFCDEDGIPFTHRRDVEVRGRTEILGVADVVKVDRLGMRFAAPTMASDHTARISVPLGGSYNVENILCAASALIALGFTLDGVSYALPHVRPVPGRFEAVPNDKGIGILVDYAHTPDALEKLLDAVRPLTNGRIITVFGCGGDRDRTKRPKMAKAASERSDVTVVTSDNPRTEDPDAILKDVLPGIVQGHESVSIVDRREAIAHAVKLAQPGDVVVIAGKGHENYQIIGRTKHHMDDRELALEAL